MIKTLCLLLSVCCIFSFYTVHTPQSDVIYEETVADSDSVSINLMSISDVYKELETQDISAESSDEYDICLLVEAR